MVTAADILVRGKDLNNQQVGPASAWVQEIPQYVRRVDLKVTGAVTTIYKAWALYGTAVDAENWMVLRTIMDETSGLDLTDEVAGGASALFNYTWDGRAGHNYS